MAKGAFGAAVLELLHPQGYADAVRVIGQACCGETSLCPRTIRRDVESADLVVLAPSSEELATPGWLEQAVREAARALRPDAILYVLAQRSRRHTIEALLRTHGLSVTRALMHHPNWSQTGALIPLETGALSYAFSRLIRTNPVRRQIALTLTRAPGVLTLVRAAIPYVGLIAHPPGAQPELHWFMKLIESGPAGTSTVLNTSWRGRDGAILLHAVDRARGEPKAIAKTWLGDHGVTALAREVQGLQEIAASAGVRVPELLAQGTLGEHPYLVETALSGAKAAAVLLDRPGLLEPLLVRLTEWLAAWHDQTAEPTVLTRSLLEAWLLRPAAELASALDIGEAYSAGLLALAGRLEGHPMPLVAVHGDLTMVNVLVDRDLRLGVIDWETSSRAGLPLRDFLYAVVDAVAALDDYQDRVGAFAACFASGGRYQPVISRLQARLATTLALTEDQLTLCFQAAWLKFALDERRETEKTAPDEFLQIARQAALTFCGNKATRESSR